MSGMRLGEIAERLGARLVGPKDSAAIMIQKPAPIVEAKAGDITFVAHPDYYRHLKTTAASAVIIGEEQKDCAVAQLIHPQPYLAFAKTAGFFFKPRHPFKGVSTQATIAASAVIGKDVAIAPNVFIAERAEIGDGAVLYPGVFIGEGAKVGAETVMRANCVIEERCIVGARCLIHAGTVIGADGFGFAPGEGEIVKIPQVGIVRLEDDIELGACCTIDRAAMGETLIKRGTKMDSKVHVGHNAIIGEHCLFSAQTAIAGSARVGNWVKSGGHAGIAGHLTVGDNVSIGAMSGVIKDAEPGETYMGFPAIPASEWRRRQVYLKKLKDYEDRLRKLEKGV